MLVSHLPPFLGPVSMSSLRWKAKYIVITWLFLWSFCSSIVHFKNGSAYLTKRPKERQVLRLCQRTKKVMEQVIDDNTTYSLRAWNWSQILEELEVGEGIAYSFSDFQLFQYLAKSKHLSLFSLFFYFRFVVRWDGKIHYTTTSFYKIFFLTYYKVWSSGWD